MINAAIIQRMLVGTTNFKKDAATVISNTGSSKYTVYESAWFVYFWFVLSEVFLL